MIQSGKSSKTGAKSPGKILSVAETAERLGAKISTVYSWVHMRKIPHYKLGGLLRFGEADIEEWISKQRVEVYEDGGLRR